MNKEETITDPALAAINNVLAAHRAREAWFANQPLGRMLREMPKNVGAAAGGTKDAPRGSFVEPRDTTPTLADLGIDKKTSSVAQKLAD